jgi:hypothetical protein
MQFEIMPEKQVCGYRKNRHDIFVFLLNNNNV